MKRHLLLANVIIIAAFFLVTLGIRNTSLDHTRGPKPRPRAVLENVTKAPIAVSCQQQWDAEVSPPVAIPVLSEAPSFYTLVVSHTPALAQLFFPSRASPEILSGIS